MKIKKILRQVRRDFTASYECEHCGDEYEGTGYDDSYYHRSVVPAMKCRKCDKTAGADYRPPATKHDDSVMV